MNDSYIKPDIGDVRRQQLIDATIASIGRRGFAKTTLADVSNKAGLSRGIVNFYFKSKDKLLLATLQSLADEYTAFWKRARTMAGPSAVDQLDAMIEAEFDPEISNRNRVAAWDAFWAEAWSRQAYRKVCTEIDVEYTEAVQPLCQRIIDDGNYNGIDAATIVRGFTAMTNGLWHDLMMDPKSFDRSEAKRICRVFLAALFPKEFGPRLGENPVGGAAESDDRKPPARRRKSMGNGAALDFSVETLPAWTYDNAELCELEMENIFRRTWQLVAHVSEVPEAGDFTTLDMVGERAIVIRGHDGVIRAFHNVCRHRASRVVAGESGHCERALVCPYHGWTYDFDGRLKAVPAEKTFPGLDRGSFGLTPLDLEIWLGFVFVRFAGSGPSVAEMMAPYATELAPYRLAELKPLDRHWQKTIDVDWKNVMDNFLEGYHIPVGHPGLYRLFGGNYEVEVQAHGVARAFSWLRDKPSSNWSERHYQKVLPDAEHLPEGWKRAWVYYSLFPTTTLNVYPDQISYFQMFPLGPGRSVLRARSYGLADSRPAMRAARYLNNRINTMVQEEDEQLVDWVQRGLGSSSYQFGLFSDKEICLRQFHDMICTAVPVARMVDPPPVGSVAEVNRTLAGDIELPA